VSGDGIVKFHRVVTSADSDTAVGPADRNRGLRAESGTAQPGEQGDVGLERLTDAADDNAADRLRQVSQGHHALGGRLPFVVAEFGEPGNGVPVRGHRRVAEDIEDPAFHRVAHHMLPPAGFVVDHLPVQAEDVDEQALREPRPSVPAG